MTRPDPGDCYLPLITSPELVMPEQDRLEMQQISGQLYGD
jgi:hypothetical protein